MTADTDPRRVATEIVRRRGVVHDSEIVACFIDLHGTLAFEAMSDTAWRALAKEIRDAVAAAIITIRWPGESEPAGYVVGLDDGDHLTVGSCGAFSTEAGARDEAARHGEGWAVYAAYPVGGAR